MDKNQEASYIVDTASALIQTYYSVKEQEGDISVLIKDLNKFLNTIKDWQVDLGLLDFLYEMSVFIGLPQYFEMFLRFSKTEYEPRNTSAVLTAKIVESSLVVGKTKEDEYQKLHKYQKEVIDMFIDNVKNRYFLTAPTSFGKTFIVNEIIKKMKYRRVVLIFPTLSLLAENYAKLLKDKYYSELGYKIYTLSNFEMPKDDESAIWIYTPERFMTMTDKYPNISFDFVFMDEVYKIDNEFIIDKESVGESERDISFRVALSITCKKSKDFLLAGPYIAIPRQDSKASIICFLEDNEVTKLDYNNIEIVDKEVVTILEKRDYEIDGICFSIENADKHKRLAKTLGVIGDNSIIYIDSRANAERIARTFAKTRPNQLSREMLASLNFSSSEINKFINFVNHLAAHFTKDWVLVDCLMKRVGIHHGYIPKYIQKEVINFFNVGILNCIFSTTTITEGVNTSAKNMIVMSDKKGDKPLKKFDAQNIAGRAGRFIHHFKGRVIAIDNNFEKILNADDSYINHVNYDNNLNKKEVDLLITSDKYLTDKDKKTRTELLDEAKRIRVSSIVVEQFKSIPLSDKILLYKEMLKLTNNDVAVIEDLTKKLLYRSLSWDGLECILKYIYPILRSDSLKRLIDLKTKKGYSFLTVKINSYIEGGYNGIFRYEVDKKGSKVDKAAKDAAELSFNLFRYNLVKYLGIFDLIYRCIVSDKKNCTPDDMKGISVLLQLLEYSSLTENGKIISDYGVPFRVLNYIDTQNSRLKEKLDRYELETLARIKELFGIE